MKYKQEFFDNKVVDNLLSEKIFTWPCKVIVSFSDINIALLNLFNNENKIAALSLNIF